MNVFKAALVLGLLAAGCADAHAQPRRDAGAARRWIVPRRPSPVRGLFLRDGGVPEAFVLGPMDNASDIRDVLAGAAISAGPPAPATNAEAVGTMGSPHCQGRFDVAERLTGITPDDARIWLFVAQGWVLRCLERVRLATPFDAPVRFTVARDGAVAGVAAEGAPEAAVQCLVEGLGHARFHPVAQPAEVVARYRYTVRGSPPRASAPRQAR